MGSVWMALLRSPKSRNAGIKYLNQRIERLQNDDDAVDSDYSSEEEEIVEEKKSLPP